MAYPDKQTPNAHVASLDLLTVSWSDLIFAFVLGARLTRALEQTWNIRVPTHTPPSHDRHNTPPYGDPHVHADRAMASAYSLQQQIRLGSATGVRTLGSVYSRVHHRAGA